MGGSMQINSASVATLLRRDPSGLPVLLERRANQRSVGDYAGFSFQMSRLYSAMVRSVEKKPDEAVLRILMRVQFA
jgi:hypothetical protein